MRILLVSDTHRKDELLKFVIEKEKPFDAFCHMGDSEGRETPIRYMIDADCECYMVAGNNDFFSELPKDRTIELLGKRIFITHGHIYGVNYGLENLKGEAKTWNCDIALYGHTHRPFDDVIDGVRIINPGSLGYPRQMDRMSSYMVMDIDESGEVKVNLKTIDREDETKYSQRV